MKRIVASIVAAALLLGCCLGVSAWTPPQDEGGLDLGGQWYRSEGVGGAYVVQEDESVLHTDTGWFCQRAYIEEVGSDCTIEMTFTPASEYVYWGVVARLDSPVMPLEVGEGGCVTARILGTDGLQVTGQAGGNTPIADYAGGQKYVLRMVLSGSQVNVYLNDMETPIATGTSERTGKYAGFYLAQGSGSVIHSYKVNGETLLGKEEDAPEIIPEENIDPNLGIDEWYFPNGGGGTYTWMDDGTYLHSDTTWFCHRTYLEKVGPDCTIEFTFIPSSEFVYWGVYARLDRVTDTPLELSDINNARGVRVQILGTDGLFCTGSAGHEPVEGYSGGQAHILKLVLNGNKATVYFDDMDTPFGEHEVTKTTGDYVGFYIAQGNDSVIQSLKINNELVLGVDLDQAEADNVMDLIDEIPSTDDLTLNHRSKVSAARRAYDALTTSQQELVTKEHLDRLQAAEQRIEELKEQEEADKAKAKEVDDAVNALPSIKALAKTDREAVDGAWAKYEALSENQKTYVTARDTLEAAKARLDLLLAASDADIAAAKAADEAIDAIPSLEELAYADKGLVDEASSRVEALSDGQKALVLGLETLKSAEEKIAKLRPNVKFGDISADGRADAADALLALQHSVELIHLEGDKFTAGDVTGDGVIDAADALCILQHSVGLIDQFEVEKA